VGASERDEEARSAWRKRVSELDPRKLVFVDECATNIGLTPLWARAPKGERAFGKAPRNRGKNTTLLSALSSEGAGPAVAVEGATTKAVFEAYVEHFLAPALEEGQEVVVLDNLQAHKGERVRLLVEARGASLVFLPSYSPDFSPIEEAFSKLKALLRRARARTREALVEALGWALETITPEDARGWFNHCGYTVADQSS
jgi:transposase